VEQNTIEHCRLTQCDTEGNRTLQAEKCDTEHYRTPQSVTM